MRNPPERETPGARKARTLILPKPRPSVTKRLREQKNRDRQLEKEQRRALRKSSTAETSDEPEETTRSGGE